MTLALLLFLTVVCVIINTDVLCGTERQLWSTADDSKYGYFDDRRRLEMLEATRHMFYFGYDSYMTHAFPKDELDPIHCTGRGPDYDNPYVAVNAFDTCGQFLFGGAPPLLSSLFALYVRHFVVVRGLGKFTREHC